MSLCVPPTFPSVSFMFNTLPSRTFSFKVYKVARVERLVTATNLQTFGRYRVFYDLLKKRLVDKTNYIACDSNRKVYTTCR